MLHDFQEGFPERFFQLLSVLLGAVVCCYADAVRTDDEVDEPTVLVLTSFVEMQCYRFWHGFPFVWGC